MKSQKVNLDRKSHQLYFAQLKKINTHKYYDAIPDSSSQYTKFLGKNYQFWADVSFKF